MVEAEKKMEFQVSWLLELEETFTPDTGGFKSQPHHILIIDYFIS